MAKKRKTAGRVRRVIGKACNSGAMVHPKPRKRARKRKAAKKR